MRRVSINARRAFDAELSGEVEVALFRFEHASLAQPILLSTDPTTRLSTDPLIYGTRSAWMGADPATEPYLFVLASAEIPGDQEDAPAAATIVLENVTNEIAAQLRAIRTRATVHMAVVLASTPDVVEVEFRHHKMISAEGDAAEVSISMSRQPIEEEYAPMDRMTRDRFPGLHR
ncbi:hypothetical protein [Salipiger profundus]|jgi:hypothetical protein|uniref:DUF1833 protein n=2 Tax=Salipiger TaxID=263377 RepID=A0A1U7CZQ4_9RHOB|nr:hypothetical protein [Salipiger profundus]APX21320.1 hypothetical protein Ga0080559_TMP524 [Salipiger profundus]GGA03286.1 hypothetical protein GCM10011326_13310 [Salipiger profundus]